MEDINQFAIYREKIMLLLDLHTKQLEKIEMKLDTRMELLDARVSIVEDKTRDIGSDMIFAKKGFSVILGEAAKISAAIITAYLLIRFGLEH